MSNEKTYAIFDSERSSKIISELKKREEKIVLFPVIEIGGLLIDSKIETALKNLSAFDWIIFANVFAAAYFIALLENLEIDFFELDALRVCAVGETTADRLRFVQIHSDVISNTIEAETVFRDLINYEPDLARQKILFLGAKDLANEIPELITKTGAEITKLSVYTFSIGQRENLPKLEALLKGGSIDEFIFASAKDVLMLAHIFPHEKISALFSETIVSVSEASVYQSLREFKLTRIKIFH